MRQRFAEQDQQLAQAIHEQESTVRRHARRPIVAQVSFESDSNFYTGVTGDISEGGVFIAADSQPPVDAEVTILLSLAGESKPLVIRGTVRWVRDRSHCGPDVASGFGVQFTRVSPEALEVIARFVARRGIVLCDV